VSILSNLWRGNLSGSNGPDWLISNDNLSPVGDALLGSIELSLEDIVGLLSLTLLKSLSNAEDGVEANLLGSCQLLGDNGVSLTIELSSLGVTNQGPLEVEVLHLVGADLTSEGSVLVGGDVLGRDLDGGVKTSLHIGDVERDWSHDDFDVVAAHSQTVESLAESLHGRDGSIALPVSSDNVLALCYLGCLYHLVV